MTVRRAAPLLVALLVALVVGAVLLTRAASEQTDVGIVVEVESVSLTDVRAFTLRSIDGRTTTYTLGELANPLEFPPSHLAEHRITLEPVRVFYREEDGERVAYRLEDAPRASG